MGPRARAAILKAPMATLFAARDAHNVARFIGDVPRGAACGCFCPVCSAPLVAKQGDELEWHFAHEAGTERPECRAGAVNLLRRLAAEELGRRGLATLPQYSVPHPIGGRRPLEWTAAPAGELQLLDVVGTSSPAGVLPLREGGVAQLFVCIGTEAPPSGGGAHQAVLVLWCPLPEPGVIRTEVQAREFVKMSMQLVWHMLPDFSGSLAAARAEARAVMERLQREKAQQAGARWAVTRRALQTPVTEVPRPRLDVQQPALAALPTRGVAPEWAPGLLVGTSIHYRELDDGSQWVCYQHAPEQWRLSPVPLAHDGWDECFPPALRCPRGPGGFVSWISRSWPCCSVGTPLRRRSTAIRS